MPPVTGEPHGQRTENSTGRRDCDHPPAGEPVEPEFVRCAHEEQVLGLLQGRPALPILVVGPNGLEGLITLDNFGELIEIARRMGKATA